MEYSDKRIEALTIYLISTAIAGRFIGYVDLAEFLELKLSRGDHRRMISHYLAEVDRRQLKLGRPILSVLVHSIRKGIDRGPSAGFFTWMQKIGMYRGDDDAAFARAMLDQCHSFWRCAKLAA